MVIVAEKTKAILYARFSPRPNAAECESCESQLADMQTYCLQHGCEIIGEFQDKALSGGDGWEDRPGMLDAMTACKKGYLFLVRAYDRLFRDTDKAQAFMARMETKGVEVRSITKEGANGNSMNAKLIRFIMLWVAECQREEIRARTRHRMRQHQKNGRRMSKHPPYGTQFDPNNNQLLVECPEEILHIRLICDHFREGKSLRAIAQWMGEHGFRCRGSNRWNHQLIQRILARAGALTLPENNKAAI